MSVIDHVLERSTKTCESCGARIVWAVTERGSKMPLNAEPDPLGMFSLLGPAHEGGPLRLHTVGEGDLSGDAVRRYTSHFASCPAAAKHRRRK